MGVEPTQDGAGRPATVLKTVAINHSATPPRVDLLDRIRANRGFCTAPIAELKATMKATRSLRGLKERFHTIRSVSLEVVTDVGVHT